LKLPKEEDNHPIFGKGINRSLTFQDGNELAEPVAALVGAAAFSLVGTKIAISSSLAFAAGMMTYITADELHLRCHSPENVVEETLKMVKYHEERPLSVIFAASSQVYLHLGQ